MNSVDAAALTDAQLSSMEIGRRQLAKRKMWDFVKYVDSRFTDDIPHAEFVCKELDEVVRFIETGQGIPLLVLTVPPRHLKTTLVADHLPAFFLGRNPEKKVIDTTYALNLALDSSKRVREMIHVTENYKNVFGERATFLVDDQMNPLPPVDLRRDTRAMDRWMIDKYGGTFQAVGFGGTVTGRGGHCFVAGTLVTTNKGELPIEAIHDGARVLSYDHDRNILEYNEVVATNKRYAGDIVTLTTSCGHRITGTSDHRVFVFGRGYIPIRDIQHGDEVLVQTREEVGCNPLCSLWKTVQKGMVRLCKGVSKGAQGYVLLGSMFKKTPRNKEQQEMLGVRGANAPQTREVLLGGMQDKRSSEEVAKNQMQVMQEGIPTKVSFIRVLFDEMQKRLSLRANGWIKESELQARNGARSVPEEFCSDEGKDYSKRSMLRCLWDWTKTVRPSQGQGSTTQHYGESCDGLQSLPHNSSQFERITVSDIVTVRGDKMVYDIQVESPLNAHNFFANGILVHNCIIVDDPHANRKEAESQTERENVWQFFISTLWTRLEKNGAIAIIMQRWHEDDLVGKLRRVKDRNSEEFIEGFPPIRFINLPALAEPDDPLGRAEGKALWPAFKDEHKLRQDQAVMGDYYFNSQYQQRATAPEGNIFKRYWFRVSPMFPLDYRIQYWDTADGEGEDNDYWSCITLGVGTFGILIEDVFREKMSADNGIEEINRRYDMFDREDEPISVVWVEAKSSGKSCVSIIRASDSNVPVDEDVPKGDKVMRAGTITTTCKNRRVMLLHHSPWIRAFLEEITSFPMGVNDDQVDCLVGGVSKIVHGGYMQTGPRVKREEKRKGSDRIGKDFRDEVFKKKRGSRLLKPPSLSPHDRTSM